MSKSFVNAERKFSHEMRHRISMSTDTGELDSIFSEITGKLLGTVIGSASAVSAGGNWKQ